jgi:peptide/nickel transport system substrate-binding protein
LEEDEKSEVIIGYEADNIDIFYGFEPYFINDLLFKGLWKKNNDGSYTPELVEDYSGFDEEFKGIITDGITITLKDDIYWQDGDPITSEDIKYTFEYFRNFIEGREYFSSLDEDYLKIRDIEVIDEKSFTIEFEELVVEWQKLFPMVFKKDHFNLYDYDDLLFTRIISNGPYRIEEYDPSGQMILELNEHYHNKSPEIERLVIKFDIDIHNLITMLKDGSLNFLSIPVDPELMHMLEEENDLSLLIKEGNLIEHLALSLKPKEE